ncbi:DUF2249 domain-containing protein [Bradyrhizobium betae]|uniref:DUF2249 domain-containing protein n=1 Tax=Bradyrhizobium betae TaxID=244734 RepID=A0A5P6NZ87_9BRAD|nr:DUF2249 domain-containing protein [Bradyrhizobium betae]MCS3725331.1 uncharacterized protein (DUF2249 family) [Bradyrhizobium betae]QFI71352.1 DUF2249 domain-containing protein [Bradyrhizobium betae]
MAQASHELDVRPILRSGGEPFSAIMQAVSGLSAGQALRLLATFEPVPLYGVLGKKGFDHAAREIGGGDWEVLFTPKVGVLAGPPTPGGAAASRWPEPVSQLDNRDLDPPEPMVRTLAAVEELQPGEVLCALLCREPVFLLPELGKRGFEWLGGFEADGTTYKLLVRKAAQREAAE